MLLGFFTLLFKRLVKSPRGPSMMANLSCQPDEIYSYQRNEPLGNPRGIVLFGLVKLGRHIWVAPFPRKRNLEQSSSLILHSLLPDYGCHVPQKKTSPGKLPIPEKCNCNLAQIFVVFRHKNSGTFWLGVTVQLWSLFCVLD